MYMNGVKTLLARSTRSSNVVNALSRGYGWRSLSTNLPPNLNIEDDHAHMLVTAPPPPPKAKLAKDEIEVREGGGSIIIIYMDVSFGRT